MTDNRSSWVRRVAVDSLDAFVKSYEYETWGDMLRNCGKHTAPWRRSRAHREVLALQWLLAHGFAAPRPLACFEWRCFGFVRRATIVTAAFDGMPADRSLQVADQATRRAIAAAIGRFVGSLHRLGFRDRNLDLRNLLVRQTGDGITIAKLDSPRFRLLRAGPANDALAAADWQRLLPQLATFAVAEQARQAAERIE